MSLDEMRNASIEEIDPFAADLIRMEDEQQARNLILIPSVSAAPRAVLQALGSAFQNVCAEGLPAARMTAGPSEHLKDVEWQLAANRRYADRRYYKGVHLTDFAEALAQRRCAEAFASGSVQPEHLHVNVQALSGGIANLAVYEALMQAGETLMGMDLYEGGHLSHGSHFNQSGQRYRVVSYAVDPETERLDYERIRQLALEHRPKVLIAGYTSYPWSPDWQAFRRIADECGAFLLADIAHTAGLVLGGVIGNPVGIADVVTLTTNKTLLGPRSAAILTTDKALARRIDQAVFPGAQGAPHPNKFVAVAVAFEIARRPEFRQLQHQIAKNARALADGLHRRGVRLVYGGTDTHLFVVDLKTIPSPTGYPLYGEPASRILELAGIIVNKNSVPGDQRTAHATGLRMGTPWLTQRGLVEADMDELAGVVHRLLAAIHPFSYRGAHGLLPRGKLDLADLEEGQRAVQGLVARTNDPAPAPPPAAGVAPASGQVSFSVKGERAHPFIQQLVTANVAGLSEGDRIPAFMLDQDGQALARAVVQKCPNGYSLSVPAAAAPRLEAWMRGHSDGYLLFDPEDVFRKVEGPVVIEPAGISTENGGNFAGRPGRELLARFPDHFDLSKPYFIGQAHLPVPDSPPEAPAWTFPEAQEKDLRHTPLYDAHLALGARLVPFAGWEMPLRYASVAEEHRAVRQAAGLFDVAHMGIFAFEGPHAAAFLDAVFSNYVRWLADLQACYGYLLAPDGAVIDDALVYRLAADDFLMVVNAANEARAWDWLNSVNAGSVAIDSQRPWIGIEAPAVLHDLKAPAAGVRQLRDLALQGPASLPTLQALAAGPDARFRLGQLPRNQMLRCELGGIPVLAARTGYTGEEWGFEIFVHPDQLPPLWERILAAGAVYGVRPAGLGARDSLRIEAGLPLYGQELAGPFGISPVEAGFPGFVKYHKPFFVGRGALLAGEESRRRTVVRFTVDQARARRPRTGDPIFDSGGKLAGHVTSCSIDAERRYIGQAVLACEHAEPGTTLLLRLQGGVSAGRPAPPPVPIRLLPRFPQPESDLAA